MNRKAFTLIELLAVIIILGVIMTIAVPNIVSTIDRNKKATYLEDAKRMIAAAEYKIRSDVSIEYPTANSITIIRLAKLDNSELSFSPYDTPYSKEKSFVAIIRNNADEYVYYARLISCSDEACENLSDDSVGKNRGITLANLEQLNSSGKYDLVIKGATVDTRTLLELQIEIRNRLGKTSVKIY